MRYLIRALWLVVFVFLLGFAVKNSAVVTVRFFFDSAWQVPLVMVMFLFFLAGAVVCLVAVLDHVLRQRREILRLRHDLQRVAPAASADRPLGIGNEERTHGI